MPQHDTWSPYTLPDVTGMTPFLGPCWMDDIAICITADTCQALESKAGIAGSILIDMSEAHGMCPNLQPNKTEILMVFKGRGSRALKTKYYKPGEPAKIPMICEDKTCHLHVTSSYLHLGNILHHSGRSGRSGLELRRRVAISQQAFGHHRKLFFHNKTLEWSKRKEIFDTLILSKLLYGAETWALLDDKTMAYFHAAVLRLYKRLLRHPPDAVETDNAVLAAGDFISPSTLLRRQRLRYLGVLHRCNDLVPWGLLVQDESWQALVRDDLEWMHEQLHHASDLPDPSVSFQPWNSIMKFHQKYWKRLVNRAVQHETRQRAREEAVLRFHRDLFIELQRHGSLSCDAPLPKRKLTFSYYGCMKCQVRCRSYAGESVHMCKAHGTVAAHRFLFEGTQCPQCLKEFFTHAKLSNHLRGSRQCRHALLARGHAFHPEPGHGSKINEALEKAHDGICPPLPAEGPHVPPSRAVDPVNYDLALYDTLALALIESTETVSVLTLTEKFKQISTSLPVPWSKYVLTLKALSTDLTEDDASLCGVPLQTIRDLLAELCDPAEWPMFNALQTDPARLGEQDLIYYETWMQRFISQNELWTQPLHVPRPLARERIVLHAFSGRRRIGDVQYYLDRLQEQHDACLIIMVSVDIVIDPVYGDVSRGETREFWLHAIRCFWVIGFLGGPPCNTWSRARGQVLQDKRGPRIVRTNADPWGLTSLRLRELEDVHLGNVLLCFALEALCALALTSGIGLLERPSEPEDESLASIWRLFVMHILLKIPGVELLRVAQGLYGAASSKPTELLVVGMPDFRQALHSWRITKDLPKAVSIGCSATGQFKTSGLKEYPPAFCCGIAQGFWDKLTGMVGPDHFQIPEGFLVRCEAMRATEYGEFYGPDLAGHA